ncbi:hypothetical protein C8C83_2826 [Flavobacterium sp. 90]|uniref:hypothetical protein n=1 Tax=unclassified Flavobacterium TaxID=196869 RepID=UPI000EB1DACC|nr:MULTISPECIES: hypothetical protein [unclassified Flavobacterium]RKR11130.1 hypothetical protein C8C82_3136 [Flavobacterium sp. 81]TCK54911.1 hypothetical protein C8C83_2826 [Flavobacterium sp. 90]
MKTNITILFFLLVNFLSGQTKESDYYSFYKGGNKSLKPIKYILFNSKENDAKVQREGKIYFKIKSERFVFDKKKHRADTCLVSFLNNIKLENIAKLRENEVLYYKTESKKTDAYKKSGFIPPFPVTSIHPYFKVYVVEKIKNDKLIKYEVDWEYSDF